MAKEKEHCALRPVGANYDNTFSEELPGIRLSEVHDMKINPVNSALWNRP